VNDGDSKSNSSIGGIGGFGWLTKVQPHATMLAMMKVHTFTYYYQYDSEGNGRAVGGLLAY
jgi:hypothetical protein